MMDFLNAYTEAQMEEEEYECEVAREQCEYEAQMNQNQKEKFEWISLKKNLA